MLVANSFWVRHLALALASIRAAGLSQHSPRGTVVKRGSAGSLRVGTAEFELPGAEADIIVYVAAKLATLSLCV